LKGNYKDVERALRKLKKVFCPRSKIPVAEGALVFLWSAFMESQNVVLGMQGISKHFGGIKALEDAKIACVGGEVHAILGENGAGKSTLVKVLCGVVKKDEGRIIYNGQEVQIDSPLDAEKLGIVAVFQELSLVQDLSVAENIFLGFEPTNRWGSIDWKKMRSDAQNLLSQLGVVIDVDTVIADLPLAQQQMVEISKAFLKKPNVIVFDEATSALGQAEVDLLFKLIRDFVAKGKIALFISHRMDELSQIADTATIYRDAHYVSTFKMGDISDQQIIEMVAGHKMEDAFPERRPNRFGETVLEVRGLNSPGRLRQISFSVKKGEILGIAGLQGHGQDDLLHCLYGDRDMESGEIFINGKPVHIKTPRDAIKNNIVLIPEDRKNEGLLLPMSVRHNLSMMVLRKLRELFYISDKKENSMLDKAVLKFQIKTPNLNQAVVNLSGGNQQKVVFGKTLLTDADILLFSDPTRGIDVGTKIEMYHFMRDLSEDGKTILFYSTEIDALIGVCDRVLIFREGSLVVILEQAELNEKTIIQHLMGISKRGNAVA
jgi:ribose transport system ATP-binding protein